jgi:hypothetical protein
VRDDQVIAPIQKLKRLSLNGLHGR